MKKFSPISVGIIRVKFLTAAIFLLLSTSAGFVGGWLGARGSDRQRANSDMRAAQQVVLQEGQVISNIAKTVGASVVSVNAISETTTTDFFGFGQSVEQPRTGTGFVLSKEGIIVTNRHVVPAGTNEVSVTLSDGTELDDVTIIGRTRSGDPLDIAFLKINDTKGKELSSVILGDSSKAQVGERVVAIGNALGQFQNTVTTGILSGYGRTVEIADETGVDTLQNLFQTDAAINGGNSGGPLVNLNGEVIGINTAAAAGGAENIGFAIPINDVKGLITSVLETGKLERPYLGIRYIQLTDDLAYELNLTVNRGAYIVPGSRSIQDNGPAAKAGLREKDIITKVNEEKVDEQHSLTALISKYRVGQDVTLTIVRDGQEQKVTAKLEAAPEE